MNERIHYALNLEKQFGKFVLSNLSLYVILLTIYATP